VSLEDIARTKDLEQSLLDFDVVLVDEGQDWPQAEADLLSCLYDPKTILVADGLDQLVRGERTNWHLAAGGKDNVLEKSLTRSLRMKRSLGVFVNTVADLAGLNWSIEPSDEAAGGKIIIANRPYNQLGDLRRELVEEARNAGNFPIDLLHCVPSTGVVQTAEGPRSHLAQLFEAEDLETWDAVNRAARRDFPRSLETYRIVQYESCRGLEGWVTVLDGLDEFWKAKFEQSKSHASAIQDFTSPQARASRVVWQWVMIALTRPIDTLVITLRDPTSEVARVLAEATSKHGDLVRWIA